MMQGPAIEMGLQLSVLAEATDAAAALVVPSAPVGDHTDLEAVLAFARECDVVTFDHEHVPPAVLVALEAEGVVLHPRPSALRFAQDKLAMRERLTAMGVPCPRWAQVRTAAELQSFGDDVGWPVVLKASTGGYDGKGVWVIDSADAATDVLASGAALLVEELVAIEREFAAVVARSPFGQGAAWPVVETVQREGICVQVIAPAPDLDDELAEHAQNLALRIAAELGVTGVLAVELFQTHGALVVNELAMRPHNSAHWTIEGSRTSQFEQHLRAVLDYPLGSTRPTAPVTVMVNLLGGPADVRPAGIDERVHHFMAHWPGVKLHLYGKQFRPGRKVGHVTALGDDVGEVRARAAAAAEYLMKGDPR